MLTEDEDSGEGALDELEAAHGDLVGILGHLAVLVALGNCGLVGLDVPLQGLGHTQAVRNERIRLTETS